MQGVKRVRLHFLLSVTYTSVEVSAQLLNSISSCAGVKIEIINLRFVQSFGFDYAQKRLPRTRWAQIIPFRAPKRTMQNRSTTNQVFISNPRDARPLDFKCFESTSSQQLIHLAIILHEHINPIAFPDRNQYDSRSQQLMYFDWIACKILLNGLRCQNVVIRFFFMPSQV